MALLAALPRLEAVADLLLVDGILRIAEPAAVVLHVKDRPVFVSDVCAHDIDPTVDWLDARGGVALAGRLRKALADQRLQVSADPFYTSASAWWEMPDTLREEYAAAGLVICKGDANYRRLIGDRHWAHTTPFPDLMRSYWPTSVCALRTCKSGVLVGVDAAVEAAASASATDVMSKWLTSGKHGVVSLANIA